MKPSSRTNLTKPKPWVVVSVDADHLIGIRRYALRQNAEFHRNVLYQRHPTGTYQIRFDPVGRIKCLNDQADGNSDSRFWELNGDRFIDG